MKNLTHISTPFGDFAGSVMDFYDHVLAHIHSEISMVLSDADTHREVQRLLQAYCECHRYAADDKTTWHDYDSGFSTLEPITLVTSIGVEEAGLICEIVYQLSAAVVGESDFALTINIRRISLVD